MALFTCASLGSTDADASLFRTGAASVSPGTTTSLTFTNFSASNSPANTPLTISKTFARGAVPTGYIAVPTVSGTPLLYQADNRKYWDDGSLGIAVYTVLPGAITAGAGVKVDFPISAGSYSNTSSNTPADITGNSDFKIAITNLHTAQVPVVGNGQCAISLTMSGGAITGGTCWANHAGLSGTLNVQNGNGSGGQVSISGTTVTLVAGGSGYAPVGTGAFNIGFNDIITYINANGNHNGVSLVQYKKGPYCDAWRARMQIAGLPHAHFSFYMERYKDAGGAFSYFKAYCVIGNGMVDAVNALYNYTFSLDWKNGSTIIRGTTNGDLGWTNNTLYMGGSQATFTRGTLGLNYIDTARPDWSSNGAILNAIIVTPTATEADQIKNAGFILPWLAITPTVAIPTVTASYTTGNTEDDYLCIYQPNGSAGMRCPAGSGGNGHGEAPMADSATMHWMWSKQANPTNAKTWLTNARTAAAHALGVLIGGSGMYDPTTLYVPNIIPASAQTFTGMTPTLETHYSGDLTMNGYMHPYIEGGDVLYKMATYHQSFYSPYIYIMEGEQWALDAVLNNGTVQMYVKQSPVYNRQATVGATTYYGVWANWAINDRIQAWGTMASGFATILCPIVWADGATNIEPAFARYVTGNTFTYLNALVPATGTVLFGTNYTLSKTIDYTGSGVHPESFTGNMNSPSGLASEVGVPFMDDYFIMNSSYMAFHMQGTAEGTAIATWRDYFKLQYVGCWAYTGSHYCNDTYRRNVLVNPAPNSAVSDATWQSEGNVVSPALAVYPFNAGGQIGQVGITINFTSGNSTIQLVAEGTNNPDSMCLIGSTRFANGSRVKLTTTRLININPMYSVLPGGFDGLTWYYWKELTPTTGQLCSDAALTIPVVPSTGPSDVGFWVVPSNTLPADNSGLGTYGSQGTVAVGHSRPAVINGVLNLMKRYGVNDNNVSLTNARANLNDIWTSGSGSYADYPPYAYDNAA